MKLEYHSRQENMKYFCEQLIDFPKFSFFLILNEAKMNRFKNDIFFFLSVRQFSNNKSDLQVYKYCKVI